MKVTSGSPKREGPPVLRPRRVAAAAGGLAIVLAVASFLRFDGGPFLDAPSFWVGAAAAFVAGVPAYGDAFRDLAGASVAGYVHPFVYPPPTLPLLAPLAAAEYPAAARLLLVANIACAALAGALSAVLARPAVAEGGGARWWPAVIAVAVLVALAAQPTRITLGHGQLNLVVLALALGGLALGGTGPGRTGPGRTGLGGAGLGGAGLGGSGLGGSGLGGSGLGGGEPGGAVAARVAAGACIALAVLLKLHVAVLLPLLLLRGDRVAVGAAGGTLALAGVASLLVLPAGTWAAWHAAIVAASSETGRLAGVFDIASAHNVSLVGALLRADPGLSPALVQPVVLVVVVGASLLPALLRRRARRPAGEGDGGGRDGGGRDGGGRDAHRERGRGADHEAAALLAAAALAAPNAWVHYLVFALPGAVLLAAEAWRARSALLAAVALAALAALVQNPLTLPVPGLPRAGAEAVALSFTAVTLVVWAGNLAIALRQAAARRRGGVPGAAPER